MGVLKNAVMPKQSKHEYKRFKRREPQSYYAEGRRGNLLQVFQIEWFKGRKPQSYYAEGRRGNLLLVFLIEWFKRR
jgi:hypothetical protein